MQLSELFSGPQGSLQVPYSHLLTDSRLQFRAALYVSCSVPDGPLVNCMVLGEGRGQAS